MLRKLLLVLGGWFLTTQMLWAWNSVGHRVITQIAYDHLTPHAKKTFNKYNHALDVVYKPQSLVNASVWLDGLRFKDVNWFNNVHYIDWYFSEDNSPIPETKPTNALWAIKESTLTLVSPKSNQFDKGVSLRVLIHVVGDIHQPLHATNKVSKTHPKGDVGGNLVTIGDNAVLDNLHWYWDQGAGYLAKQKRYSRKDIKALSSSIEKSYPCSLNTMDINPDTWAKESHQLAIKHVYTIKPNETPNDAYQKNAQSIAKKRVAIAGCRLAALLNQIDGEIVKQQNQLAKSDY